jgi:hypothetical protein
VEAEQEAFLDDAELQNYVSFPRAAWECGQGALRRELWFML